MKTLNLIFVMVCMTFIVNAQSTMSKGKLKSLYIYNFIKYIEYPVQSESIVMSIACDKVVFEEIKAYMDSRSSINGKKILVKMFNENDVNNSQIIFVDYKNKYKLEYLNSESLHNKLVVTDSNHKYANIQFMRKNNNSLGFKVYKDKCESNGLKIPTSLLSLSL